MKRALSMVCAVGFASAAWPCLAAAPLAAKGIEPRWCTVSPAVAAQGLGPVVKRLKPLLDSQPEPMAYMHTEGTLPGKGIREESMRARRQLPIMRDAAYAWRAGAGDAYYALAERYLTRWAAVYEPSFNPIDETGFDAFIDTYAVLAPKMDPAARETVRAYLVKWGHGYVREIEAQRVVSESPQANKWNNNWQSHRVKLVTMAAVATHDADLFNLARALFRKQIAQNMHGDGEILDFKERDALHYVVYSLEPLLQAALAARVRGEDWYLYASPTGSSLMKGVKWLHPYATGEKTHQEFANSTVKFDAERLAAGQTEFSGLFKPSKAATVYWLASEFEPSYRELARSLRADRPLFLSLCGN
ncbi:alginate lyase family protein [Asticcacaulis sp. AND118]|uniref:alginate lyase family protein n=1 Tax=Asticcacaulis sp. AND118 TaxID=2840468 RepID=UPI001D000453|nr:alginate lyase family protein [Asticcacaulis sp. AND118]UDF05696.1 alginate lyase family protein [Asticcacaulis sp. AND118]